MRYPHVMIDLETLGLVPGSTVLSIGAVAFDPFALSEADRLGPKRHIFIDRADSFAWGLLEDQDTIDWWAQQSYPATRIFDIVNHDGKEHHLAHTVAGALEHFNEYLREVADGGELPFIWGNGASFDNSLLEAVYRQVGTAVPWHYTKNRCFRTLRGLVPSAKMPRSGTLHDALDDAVTQANHAVYLLRALNGIAGPK